MTVAVPPRGGHSIYFPIPLALSGPFTSLPSTRRGVSSWRTQPLLTGHGGLHTKEAEGWSGVLEPKPASPTRREGAFKASGPLRPYRAEVAFAHSDCHFFASEALVVAPGA